MQGFNNNHVGERRLNNQGHEMVVIACRSAEKVMIRFENGTTKDNVNYQHFRKGSVRMPELDHLGNKFPSRLAMCKHYGVSYNLFKNRIKNGWSLEAALSPPKERNIAMIDHQDIEHVSLRQAAKAYDLNEKTLRQRLQHDWTLEESLTITPNKSNRIRNIRRRKDLLGDEMDDEILDVSEEEDI